MHQAGREVSAESEEADPTGITLLDENWSSTHLRVTVVLAPSHLRILSNNPRRLCAVSQNLFEEATILLIKSEQFALMHKGIKDG